METKISVIIPIYNRSDLIIECIESVQRQSLRELEIICIDDGSTDDSADIIKKLSMYDCRIKLIRQENQGAGVARNIGILSAKGKYVSFLDSDDTYVEPDALNRMIEACENNGFPICGARVFWKYNNSLSEYTTSKCFLSSLSDDGTRISFNEYQSDRGYCGFIYKRQWLIDNNILFPRYMEYEDPVFFLKAMIISKEFWFIPTHLLAVRVWDHDNESRRESAIEDILSGVTENLRIAGENRLYKLYADILARISSEYRLSIVNNISESLLLKLVEINRINHSFDFDFKFEILDDIFHAIKNMNYFRRSKRSLIPKIIEDKIHKIGMNKFKNYFIEMSISKVTMYGAGNYGNAFYILAEECGIYIEAIVDKEALMWNDKRVLNPNDELPQTDAIIVTMNEYQSVLSDLKGRTKGVVLSFMEILSELENGI